jgi:hypothetical protein
MTKPAIVTAAILAIAMPAIAFAQSAPAPAMNTSTAADATRAAESRDPNLQIPRPRFRASCATDIAKHCKDVVLSAPTTAATTPDQLKHQRASLRACLTVHASVLTADCRAAIAEPDATRQASRS